MLQVHGRSNYELLYQVNEALELASLVPRQHRTSWLRQLTYDRQ